MIQEHPNEITAFSHITVKLVERRESTRVYEYCKENLHDKNINKHTNSIVFDFERVTNFYNLNKVQRCFWLKCFIGWVSAE